MNQLKRQLSANQLSEGERWQFPKINDDESTTYIENLSNEVFFEIFDYLDGYDIFYAFSNLNFRFQNLLSSSNLLLKIKLSRSLEWIINDCCDRIIIPNKHRIISLHITEYMSNILHAEFFPRNASFNRLESLVLYQIPSAKLESIIVDLYFLPRLFSLTVIHDAMLEDVNDAVPLIFGLPLLKYCRISFCSYYTLSLPVVHITQLSSIEHLVFDKSWYLEGLILCLSYTSRIKRFVCEHLSVNRYTVIRITLSHLTHMTINNCALKFKTFEKFIRDISSQLQVLRINTAGDVAYLDADRWERLISKYLPHLRIFDFQYQELINADFEITSFHTLINRFKSAFWIKKQWFLEFKFVSEGSCHGTMFYSVGPLKKRSYDFSEHLKNDRFLSQNIIQQDVLSETIPCTLSYYSHDSHDLSFMNCVGPILITSQITRLIIAYKIPIDILSKLIGGLPNLTSLVVHSFDYSLLSFMAIRFASNKEEHTVHSKPNGNKILRVYLKQTTALYQIESLIDLCPLIEHLDLMYINDIDLPLLLQLILTKHGKDILHNFTLCLKNYQVADTTIQKLQEVINAEKRHHDCMLTYASGNIYLECKF